MMGISEIRKQARRTRSIWAPSVMQTLFVALMCVLITVSRSDFSVQHWMSLLYPIMTATCFMATVVMVLYYISVRPVRLVLATAFYLISETVVLALLTLTTGAHPVLSVDQYRPLVAWARFFNWLALVWIIHDGAGMVFRDLEKLKKGEL